MIVTPSHLYSFANHSGLQSYKPVELSNNTKDPSSMPRTAMKCLSLT